MKKTTTRWLVAILAAALTACGGGLLGNQGRIRLVNAATGLGALDLYIDNAAAITGVATATGSDYVQRKADTYPLDIRQTGNGATLLTTSTALAADKHKTVVAYNNGGTVSAAVLDDEEGDPGRGKAKLRIFNTATATADQIDVYLITDACSKLDASAAAPTASAVSGLQTAYSELTASATSYHLCVTSAGDKGDVRLDVPSFVLSEKRIVTVILARGAGGYLMNAIVLDQQGAATQALNTLARARVATSASAPVGVSVNGTVITAGLPPARVGSYAVVPAGAVMLQVNGKDVPPVAPFTAVPGADLTVLLMGGVPTATLLADDNTPSTSASRPARLRLVHGVNNGGDATLTVNGAVLGGTVARGSASPYGSIAASAGHAQLEAFVGGASVYSKSDVTFESGRVYTLFLLGDASATPTGILVQDK